MRVAILALVLVPMAARADVCVWRDPERTMARLFPAAQDYRTVTHRITPEIARKIEERIGTRLEDSERSEFNYYEITGKVEGRLQRLGTVLALAGPGDYGTVEVVVGLGPDNRIVGVYIQRMRERSGDKLRAEDFLGQFRGKTHGDSFEVERDIRPVPEAMKASNTVAFVVRKMLVFYEVLR